MVIISVKEFRDNTTAKTIDKMEKIMPGTLIDCDEGLAQARIDRGLCIKVLNPEILVKEVEVEKKTEAETDKSTKNKDKTTE